MHACRLPCARVPHVTSLLSNLNRYTEAITLVGTHTPVLFVNRAMAHRRREDWDKVMEDTATALKLDGKNMKVRW